MSHSKCNLRHHSAWV